MDADKYCLTDLEGVQLYERDSFEKKVVSNIDAIQREENKKLANSLNDELRQLEEKLRQLTREINQKLSSTSVSRRVISKLVDQQTECKRSVFALKTEIKSLTCQDSSENVVSIDQTSSNEISIKSETVNDEEHHDAIEISATSSVKSERNKKQEIDDSNLKTYCRRLKNWKKTRMWRECPANAYEKLDSGLYVPQGIWKELFEYQKVSIDWLYGLYNIKVGGILGDEMGLGKTIQIIAYLASLNATSKRDAKNNASDTCLSPVLIVCPTTVMEQWVKEFHKWSPNFRVVILHNTSTSGSCKKSARSQIHSVISDSSTPQIMITSYKTLLTHKKDLVKACFEYLILDEGHRIRNPHAQITLAMKQFHTPNRIILSGSPFQNNLKELWSIFDFIYPGKLGSLPIFMEYLGVPITQGGYSNANRVQMSVGRKCTEFLKSMIDPYILRREKNDVHVERDVRLPDKSEHILFCRLTESQSEMYKSYLKSRDIQDMIYGRMKMFVGLTNLRKICNHPKLLDLKYSDETSTKENNEIETWKMSGKMIVLDSLLRHWSKTSHKVLLFTQSTKMLSLLEDFIKDANYSYLKMCGDVAIKLRSNLVDQFNNDKNIFIFLLTTRVGGLGLNLVGADRVILYDPDWNPSTDTQARERAWRIGQQKQVTIYRLLTVGTIEEKIYHRQIFKQLLVNRVLCSSQGKDSKRFFSTHLLHDLFTYNEPNENNSSTVAHNDDDRTQTAHIFGVKKKEKETDNGSYASQNADEGMERRKEKLMAKVREIAARRLGSSKAEKEVENDHERIVERLTEGGGGGGDDECSKSKKRKYFHSTITHFGDDEKECSGSDESSMSIQFEDDYVEKEGERVLQEAIKRIKNSRRDCFKAERGMSSWTGLHGDSRKAKD